MPIIKSSMKDVRRTKRRTLRNQAGKSKLKTAIKAVRSAKTAEEAKAKLQVAMKAIDTACANGIVKQNTASRKVSRLSAFVHKKFGSK